MTSSAATAERARVAFVLEHSLGHATHAQNLKGVLTPAGAAAAGVAPVFVDVDYHDRAGAWKRLPVVRSNWTVRASLAALLALRREEAAGGPLDGALFHTQITSVFAPGFMRRVPSVVSLDATPRQIDGLGAAYGHAPSGSRKVEELKARLTRRALHAARHLVTWSEWAKDSVVADYGVPAERVTVIPPGVDRDRWPAPDRRRAAGEPVRFLFVGADFKRKGGDTLLRAWGALPAAVHSRCRLDIVTKTENVGAGVEGVTVHRGVTPNSPELRALFAGADAFVFPTEGDCLPLAVLESLMSGLPVVTTAVGALPEAVANGEAGRVVAPGDAVALAAAIEELAGDAGLRAGLGARARRIAEERFDAAANYRRLVEVVAGVAEEGRQGRRAVTVIPARRRVA
jgi:glycosyltransferase involved in cell wall biosynthesis